MHPPETERLDLERPPFAPDSLLTLTTVPQRSLVRILATANRYGLDATHWVGRLADESSGSVSSNLRQVAALMFDGVSEVDALRLTPGVLDASTVMALELAAKQNRLPQMYAALLSNQADTRWDIGAHEARPEQAWFRQLFSAVAGCLIVTFIMTFITPTFEKMFAEFGLDLPAPTRLLISAAPYLPWILLLVVMAIGCYVLATFTNLLSNQMNRFSSLHWQDRLIPPQIQLLSLLSVAAQSTGSLASGLATLAQTHPNQGLRSRLQRTRSRIDNGESPIAALAATGLISSREHASLAIATAGAVQAWLFRWFATQRWNRARFREPLFIKSLSVLAFVLFAFVVAWTVISLFMPLVALVSGLS